MTYRGMVADTVPFDGFGGDRGEAYLARPSGAGPFPSVVVIHHAPGWDEWSIETTRRFAHHGYNAICPNLYFRVGPGDPDDIGARMRAEGGVPDAQVIGDLESCIDLLRKLPNSNKKVGAIGFCSGGRHAYLAACRIPALDAAVDCWGGHVVVDDPALITDKRPVAPIDLTQSMRCPLLGLFGNDDRSPSPDVVNRTEARLKECGKNYEFHRYEGAGHGFFVYTRDGYRQQQSIDGWRKVFGFFQKHLGTPG